MSNMSDWQQLSTILPTADVSIGELREALRQACDRIEALETFIGSFIDDFWIGCIDPQSNFALSCKSPDCWQCRLIIGRKLVANQKNSDI